MKAKHRDRTHEGEPESLLGKVGSQLSELEKRDFSVWLAVAGTALLIGIGVVFVIFPGTFLRQGNIHLELNVSREVLGGIITLLILFNTYVISRRIDARKMRTSLISTTLRSELVRLQSFTDPLTEVYNRRSLDEMASRFMSHAARLDRPLTFGLVDVDQFKKINSRFGHLTGDVVLAEIASLLKGATRGCDAVVRYGGDEFLLILADATMDGAQQVVSRISKSVQDWNAQGQLKDFEVSLSIGLAEWTDGTALDTILTTADLRMYAIKEHRKNAPPHRDTDLLKAS